MSSVFDPSTYLDATIEQPLEKRPPLEVGDYTAVIGEVKARAWQGKADPTKSGIAWDVPLTIDVPLEQQEKNKLQPTITLTDSIMLDLTEGGMIDLAPGRNRRMRNYREALDMNKAGDTFSARLMQGKILKVKITHEEWEGSLVERIGGVVKS